MKVQDLLDELTEKEPYKKFKSENPESFFTAGFFVLDLIEKCEKIQLDFFIPTDKTIAAFEHPFAEPKIHKELLESGKPLKMENQTTDLKIDIDDLEQKAKEILEENSSKVSPTKIIAILKNDIWNLTCMDNVMSLVQIKLNAVTGETAEFKKGSLMDVVRIAKNSKASEQ